LIPAAVVLLYLAVVLYIGIFAFRRRPGAEDFFLAGRSLGAFVFLFSLFGTNMTAFAILGSSGHAFNNGIVTFGLMASSSALVIPLCLFFIGTRMWSVGRKYGFMTSVQMFRDRWECGHIGTVIFALQAALLVPYIIIGVIGGGTTLNAISGDAIPYWLGGAVVAVVVMTYVFFGGMRGTAWVNTLQTILFLLLGIVAVIIIGAGMGGFRSAVERMLASPDSAPLLTRENISPLYFFSYTFIPLSSIAFPHITIMCLTARRMAHFKKTVIFYPLCMVAIWLPSVFLGVVANVATDVPEIAERVEARNELTRNGAQLSPQEQARLRARMGGDDVLLLLLNRYAPLWLAGILGAAVMAAVMASDSQILALSTMFTEDVFAYYGGKARFGEGVQVLTGRAFVVILTVAAYFIALEAPHTIFELAVQYAFTGYSALSPLLFAALFWKGSTKWGALAATLWIAGSVLAMAWLPRGTTFFGLLPVVPITIISAVLVWVVSLATPKPSAETVERYFYVPSPKHSTLPS
jgi:SSS family solute:Na+ symporter